MTTNSHNVESALLLEGGGSVPSTSTARAAHPYFFQQVPFWKVFVPFQVVVGIPPMIHYAVTNLANTKLPLPARIVVAIISALVNGEQYPQYNYDTLKALWERAVAFYNKTDKAWHHYLTEIFKAVVIPVASLTASITYYDSLYEALAMLGLSYNARWETVNMLVIVYNALLYVGEVYKFCDEDLPRIVKYMGEIAAYLRGHRKDFPTLDVDKDRGLRIAISASIILAGVWAVADWYATGYLIQQAATRPSLDWLGGLRTALQQWWVALFFCNSMNGIFCMKKAYQGLMVLGEATVKLNTMRQNIDPQFSEALRRQIVLWGLAAGSMFTAFFMAIVSIENGANAAPCANSTVNGTLFQPPAQHLYHLNLTDTPCDPPSDVYRDTLKNTGLVLACGIMAALTAFAVNARSINGSFLHFIVDKMLQKLLAVGNTVVIRPIAVCGNRISTCFAPVGAADTTSRSAVAYSPMLPEA